MTIRNISIIGALWPLCQNCKHIAQEHNEDGCGVHIFGQCPTCRTYGTKTKCDCKEYVGPTWEEFKRDYLTLEEIEYYHYKK